ncbi:MAG: SDR family NAD(P)-dependent oxidoreductase [Rhodospirillaceae bacterium]|nr:SDR family NAD(P)-dependent oxidoreductase [Rhodospirillaceae bacterium]
MLEVFRLDGRAAVVTGAGRGLGKAMALALAHAGASVVCAARTREEIDGTAEAILSAGGNALSVRTDVTDAAQVDALVAACLDTYGKIDIMLANAGAGTAHDPFWQYSDEEFRRALAVNLDSAFYCGRAAARAMVESRRGGTIINVSSISAFRGNDIFAYPTAKGGVVSLTKSQARMLGPHGIRVNVIIPGLVPQQPPKNDREAEARRRIGRRIPVGRVGECWELGPLAVYLASDASSYVTGSSFVIDGGALAGGLGPSDFAPRHSTPA